jgi:hypothetical protein
MTAIVAHILNILVQCKIAIAQTKDNNWLNTPTIKITL